MSAESLIGRQLANFKVERLLGQGGMAEVYYGRDISLQRPVAIKVIDARFRDDSDYTDRFISEAQAIARWRHENIIQVYYADKSDGLYYFVMEYVDGLDLASLLREYADSESLMPHDDVIRIGQAIASALDYAHERNVIHRDVKPANVMVASDNRVVLMDFGLALDVQQGSIGEVLGTPHYVSPEQARHSASAVPQSDVYSLGIMMFEMLTGIVPFDDPSPTAVALQHLSEEPPSPRSLNGALSQEVEDVLLKVLSKDPVERFQTASAFIENLNDALYQETNVDDTAERLPLPPGMVAPRRSMSSQTVSERVALSIKQRETFVPSQQFIPDTEKSPEGERTHLVPPLPTTESHQGTRESGTRLNPWLVLIPIVLLLVVIVGGLLLSSGSNDDGASENTLMQTANAIAFVASETVLPTDLPSTSTNVPLTATDVPSTATSVPPTATDMPATATSLLPTVTPDNATDAPALVVTASPTVLFPSGQLVRLYWNEYSFYWHNPTQNSIRVSPLDFESLDANGNALSYAFDGLRWTIGFNVVEPGRCVAIEIIQESNHLNPAQCGGTNSLVTLLASDDQVFWTTRDNIAQFRVLWDGQEVGRCAVTDQTCEVRIP